MLRFALGLVLGLLLVAGAALAQQTPPKARPTGGTARPLYTAPSTAPPLMAPCGTTAASVPLLRWGDAGDTDYLAQFDVTGTGTVTLVAGPNTATIPAPCAGCLVTVPAPGAGGLQVSVTLNAGSCPGPGLQLSSLNFKVGP